MYLGFSYRYFRGFRDLGEEGFEILEVVADPEDIMGSSGEGSPPPSISESLSKNYGRQDRLIEEK